MGAHEDSQALLERYLRMCKSRKVRPTLRQQKIGQPARPQCISLPNRRLFCVDGIRPNVDLTGCNRRIGSVQDQKGISDAYMFLGKLASAGSDLSSASEFYSKAMVTACAYPTPLAPGQKTLPTITISDGCSHWFDWLAGAVNDGQSGGGGQQC